jgi:tetratricopeptide (TPR) repeat protein
MAEGLVGGMLGGEAEERADSTQVGPEAFAAAVAANQSNQSPEVAAKTVEFFDKQIEVLEVQRKILEAEHEFFEVEAGPRMLGIRLRIGFQIFAALIATVIGIGGAVLIRDAFASRRVVIEPFEAPAPLAARGLTGKVVASGVLDQLSQLQEATRSSTVARGLSGAWTGNISLEVPETGISVSELSRLLRERFGHDVHIDGGLIETPSGKLALAVRGNGVTPKTFTGSASELEKITVDAAEYIYSKSQPERWAAYLLNSARNEEVIAFVRSSLRSVDPEQRPYMLNLWASAIENVGGSTKEALSLYRAAVKLQPENWIGHNNIQNTLMLMGDEEGAWRDGEEMRKVAGGRPGRAPEVDYANWDNLTWNLPTWLDASLKDASANAGTGSTLSAAGTGIADVLARMHDSEAAELAIKTTEDDPHDPTVAALKHFVHGLLAGDSGDSAAAAAEMEAFGVAYLNPTVSSDTPGYNCWIAPAEETAGHREKADALLKSAGTFVDCYRFRADILDGRGDWPGAQKAYADAVALAPDLPAPYYSWGIALGRRGDIAGAIEKLSQANQRGPHWADPLKAWGDLLVKQSKPREAVVKYDEALTYAPNWKQLKEAREAAEKHKR